MATLTNTQISVTYVGLLKTSGNTILDSTPQQITDGSGNNSQLFLSTAKVGIGATPSGSDTLQVQGSISITGDGSNATTLTESGSGDFTIDSADDIRLDAGGGDIVLRAAGAEFGRLSNDSTNLVIQNTTSDKDIIFKGSDDGSTITAMTIDMSAGGNVGIGTTSPDSLLEISSSSVTDFLKLTSGGSSANPIKFIFEKSSTEQGIIEYNRNGDLEIYNTDSDGGVMIDGSTSAGADFYINNSGNASFGGDVSLVDNKKIRIGSSNDLELFNDGTDSIIQNTTNNDLIIQNQVNDKDIIFKSDDGSGGTTEYFRVDGGSEKVIFTKGIDMLDSVRFRAGTSGDIQIYSDNSNSIFDFFNLSNVLFRQHFLDGDMTFQSDDGSGGVTTYFKLDGGLASGGEVKTLFPDNSRIVFGDGADFNFYHDGTDSRIQNTTGHIRIINFADDSDIIFSSDDGSGGLAEYFRLDGGTTSIIASKNVELLDNVELKIGTGNDLNIRHSGTESFIQNQTGNLTIQNLTDDADIIFKSDDGSGGVETYFFLDGSTGNTQFPDAKKLVFGSSNDMFIEHDGTNSYVSSDTGDLYIRNTADDKDVIFQSDDGSGGLTAYLSLDGSTTMTKFQKNVMFQDSVIVYYGTGFDFFITHDGTNTSMTNQTGNLTISNSADDSDITFNCDDGSGGTTEYFRVDGGSKQIRVSEELNILDNVNATFGNSNDLEISHNGTNSQIESKTGNLNIKATSTDGDIKFFLDDGSGGTSQYVRMDGGEEQVLFLKSTEHQDNIKATFGTAGDLEIYHDGSNSYIQDTGTGNLLITGSDSIQLKSAGDEFYIFCSADGQVALYNNGVKKFETSGTGVAVTGGMTLSGNVEGRKIPFVFRSSFDDSAGSTSIFVIPFDANVETTVSGADEEHIIIAPYAGELTKVQWKHVKGTLDTGFTTELFLYVNGSQQTSSGELTASSDAITWSPTSSNTFSAGDELMIAYQKSATSKDWEHVSVSVVFSFTGYNI